MTSGRASDAMAGEIRHWLVKTEPDVFSIDDWNRLPGKKTGWDGVRNYQARNFMRDSMKFGDGVLIHHSNSDPPAIVGRASVASRHAIPDPTAWDPNDPHFDPKSTADEPRWMMVELKLEEIFPEPLTLERLRAEKSLAEMELLRRGSRLSVQPVKAGEWKRILAMAAGAKR